MLSMSSDEEEYSEIATPDLINYDEKKMVTDKYGSISLCKFVYWICTIKSSRILP